MKQLLPFLFLLCSSFAGAQIVNIPDPVFKESLVTSGVFTARDVNNNPITIDANNDDEIQVSEALAVYRLRCDNDLETFGILSLDGLEAFANLQYIDFYYLPQVQEMHFSALVNLKSVIIDTCEGLNLLDVSGLANLQTLKIFDADVLDTIVFSGNDSLKTIDLEETSPVIIPFLSGFSQLENFRCIFCYDNATLNFNGLTSLKQLELSQPNLGYLTFTNLPALETLKITWVDEVDHIDLSGLPGLKTLHLFECSDLQEIDLSNSLLLHELKFDMTGLRYINLKNGNNAYTSFEIGDGWSSENVYVCLDDGEEAYFLDELSANQLQNVVLNSYCSYTPGGNYNTISGAVTFDNGNDGCNTGDPFGEFVKMSIDDGTETGSVFTGSAGQFDFYTQAGTFTITPQPDNDWFTISPSSATLTLSSVDNSVTPVNFCAAPNGVHPDVEIVVMPWDDAQPGFDADYKIIYRNKGNQALTGMINFSYDDAALDFVAATPTQTATASGQLSWSYANLLPFENREIIITLNLNGPMETPALNIGDILPFSVSATPVLGDETPSNNTFVLDQEIVGSFDPNDIVCLEGETAHPDMIGEYLHYNVNFENTGTAAATFVVVRQEIDPEMFDINTLQLMHASHDVKVRIADNTVEYRFDAIGLGPQEKGNLVFKVKTSNTLEVNDNVMQQAAIFFDYNFPIETNEALTTFEVLSRGEFEKDKTVKIFPNPARSVMNITADSNVRSVGLYDIQGRLLETCIVNDVNTTIELSARAEGLYFVKVSTDNGIKVERIMKE